MEQIKNKKTSIKNKTTQIETNNARNEHDRKSKPILFVSKYSVSSGGYHENVRVQ